MLATNHESMIRTVASFAQYHFAGLLHGRRQCRRSLVAAALALALSGCVTLDDLGDPTPELSSKLIAQMAKKGSTPQSPVLVRIFKQESELEVWKQNRAGEYALLKTYPMCRWSGKLGAKTREGDRQAPEGFYHVSNWMLNPKSQYYLSFNLGYPNKLEAALGYTGEALMVHGACSSSGCYALTDQGVSEIYAVVQRALAGGQQQFQVQAYPFRMTAENMARHRSDPNFGFWRNLKQGYDIFEVTKRQPTVSACGGRYVFNREFVEGEPKDPLAACPPGETDAGLVARLATEEKKLSGLLAEDSSTPVNGYVDGGMHPTFRALLKENGAAKLAAKISTTKYPISRPDAALADPYDGS
ncbi:exported protein (plasmid) [Sinorhizobium americanum]|uniref:Exported protein n=2 Tax=Sinorhizobium americanum TaxID=194963 RepID=A0A1L3LVI4_9HYPH|nr:exported protein [Sinorhizobium americanum]